MTSSSRPALRLARLVVTIPPEPSRLAEALAANIASEYVALMGRSRQPGYLPALVLPADLERIKQPRQR